MTIPFNPTLPGSPATQFANTINAGNAGTQGTQSGTTTTTTTRASVTSPSAALVGQTVQTPIPGVSVAFSSGTGGGLTATFSASGHTLGTTAASIGADGSVSVSYSSATMKFTADNKGGVNQNLPEYDVTDTYQGNVGEGTVIGGNLAEGQAFNIAAAQAGKSAYLGYGAPIDTNLPAGASDDITVEEDGAGLSALGGYTGTAEVQQWDSTGHAKPTQTASGSGNTAAAAGNSAFGNLNFDSNG